MSDADLQELRRIWQASGALDDEAVYLRAQLRGGVLSALHVELAHHCGHEASGRALGRPAAPAPFDYRGWLAGWVHAPPAASVRVAIALAREARPGWSEPSGEALDRAIHAAEDWARAASPATGTGAASARASMAVLEANAFVESAGCGRRAVVPASALYALDCANAAVRAACEADYPHPVIAGRRASATLLGLWTSAGARFDAPPACVAQALVPWLLGRGDPLTAEP